MSSSSLELCAPTVMLSRQTCTMNVHEVPDQSVPDQNWSPCRYSWCECSKCTETGVFGWYWGCCLDAALRVEMCVKVKGSSDSTQMWSTSTNRKKWLKDDIKMSVWIAFPSVSGRQISPAPVLHWSLLVGVRIAPSAVCWVRCPAWCSVAGLNLLWDSDRADIFIGATMVSDSIPNTFGQEYNKPRSSLCTHAFHRRLKRSWHSCPRWVNAGNKTTVSMHQPQRRNVTTCMVRLKNSHIRKNPTQNGERQR